MDRFGVDGILIESALRNPVIDQMVRHVSVRAFRQDRPLPDTLVTVLLAAAQSASTSSNFQAYSVIQVTDPERKRTVAEYANNQSFIDQAPLFLVFCADTYRLRWLTARQGYPFRSEYLDLLLISVIDSALACQNAALAAESLGLGCCIVGAVRNRPREVAELLELPPGVFAIMGLAVGYPAHRGDVKPRLPQSMVLHRERYSTASWEEGIAAYDARMAQTTIYRDRRVAVPGLTPDHDHDTGPYGWSEHTARRMARGYDLRRGLGRFLQEAGFPLE